MLGCNAYRLIGVKINLFRGAIDVDGGAANDLGPFCIFSADRWIYNLSSSSLSTGTYVITIRVPNGRRFNGGFVLR